MSAAAPAGRGAGAPMLWSSRKTLLAIEAVLDIAVNARPNPVQSREIAARQHIPQRYLEQVMQQLVKAGMLKGVRGPCGGYRLARERRRITVGDIVRQVALTESCPGAPERAVSELGREVVLPMWRGFQEHALEALDAITLEELCQRARSGGGPAADTDFTI